MFDRHGAARNEGVLMVRPRLLTHRERGVTLVELIVAMVIMMILMAIISQTLTRGMGAKDSVGGESDVSTAANEAMEQLSSDLRTAKHPARADATDTDIAAGLQDGIDISDIRVAGPYEMQLRDEAYPNNSTSECVHYKVDAQGSFWRIITTDLAGCSNTPAFQVSADRIMTGIGAHDAGTTPDLNTISGGALFVPTAAVPEPSVSFQYELAVPDVTTGSGVCDRVRTTPGTVISTPKQLAQIIGVTVRVHPVVQSRTDAADTVFTDTISVRSRAGLNYRRAIGCANGVRSIADQSD